MTTRTFLGLFELISFDFWDYLLAFEQIYTFLIFRGYWAKPFPQKQSKNQKNQNILGLKIFFLKIQNHQQLLFLREYD